MNVAELIAALPDNQALDIYLGPYGEALTLVTVLTDGTVMLESDEMK